MIDARTKERDTRFEKLEPDATSACLSRAIMLQTHAVLEVQLDFSEAPH